MTAPPPPAPSVRPAESDPLVSVITVNFNGAHLLPDLLRSLERQTYRNHEVLVVDNGSTDGSLELLARDFPDVRVLALEENAGFAGGNNAGIRAADGELVALANNDTAADPEWLAELVRTAAEDPRIGAVGSKIVFFRPFLPLDLTIEEPGERPPGGNPAGVKVEALLGDETAFAGCSYRKPILKEGFVGTESRGGRPVHRMTGRAKLFLPLRDPTVDARLHLVVSSIDGSPRRLRVAVGSTPVASFELGSDLRERPIDVPASLVRAESFDVINNAGTALSAMGAAADRGIHEPDRGQYDEPEDVDAFCGAAVLLRRSALDRVGLFDPTFFMYYEDADLSWRLRSHGERIRYQPRSVIRHLHATSSVEWSPLFTYYTARNRVLMIAKNGGPKALLLAYIDEFRCIIGNLTRALRGDAHARRELATRSRVHWSLLGQVPRALLARSRRSRR